MTSLKKKKNDIKLFSQNTLKTINPSNQLKLMDKEEDIYFFLTTYTIIELETPLQEQRKLKLCFS